MMVRETFSAAVILSALIFAFEACGSILTPQETANLSYKAQLAACIDGHKTRETIDTCRRGVERAWTVDAGAPEAGRTLDNDAGRIPDAGKDGDAQ